MAQNGMDMMVGAVLKAAGVDPEKVKADIVNFGRNLTAKIESMDNNLRELKEEQARLRELITEGTYNSGGPPAWNIEGTRLGEKFEEQKAK